MFYFSYTTPDYKRLKYFVLFYKIHLFVQSKRVKKIKERNLLRSTTIFSLAFNSVFLYPLSSSLWNMFYSVDFECSSSSCLSFYLFSCEKSLFCNKCHLLLPARPIWSVRHGHQPISLPIFSPSAPCSEENRIATHIESEAQTSNILLQKINKK